MRIVINTIQGLELRSPKEDAIGGGSSRAYVQTQRGQPENNNVAHKSRRKSLPSRLQDYSIAFLSSSFEFSIRIGKNARRLPAMVNVTPASAVSVQ